MAQNKVIRIHQYHTQNHSNRYMSGIRLVSKHGEVRTGAQPDIQFRKLPVQPREGKIRPILEFLAGVKLESFKSFSPALSVGSESSWPS